MGPLVEVEHTVAKNEETGGPARTREHDIMKQMYVCASTLVGHLSITAKLLRPKEVYNVQYNLGIRATSL